MLARICVPQKRAAVIAGGRQQFSIRTEIHRFDIRGVASQRAEFALSSHVPKLDRIIRAGRRDHLRITTEDHIGDAFAMSLDRSQLLAGLRIPKHDLSDRLDFQVLHEIFGAGWGLIL